MAKIKIEEIIEYLDSDMKKALKDAVDRASPGNNIDKRALFKEFKRAVGKKCSTWETVPDKYVKLD